MKQQEHELVAMIDAARTDGEAADDLVQQYLPFIKSEAAKFMQNVQLQYRDDDLSVAMYAFYEAAMAYDYKKGSFLAFAATAIKNRLIDFMRKEQRHMNISSLDEPLFEENGSNTRIDQVAAERDYYEERSEREAAKGEIKKFSAKISRYGLTLSEVADSSPKQKRTVKACHKVLAAARTQPELLDSVENTGNLPVKELTLASGVPRKTIDRHRKYLLAILLAYTNGFKIIRQHLEDSAPIDKGVAK
ncbi:MAG: sigma factor [Eubacteriales bacterium]|nr:sigma factor [Eubacteriales bacterium]MDD4540806.1 sigma factor [Eubacteriales bacterium]